MGSEGLREHAVTLLQDLGLKQYEARCFVALTRLPTAKAREIGDVADVPRTRVYEAVENLAELGLVETQETSPKRFRAVSIDEALTILRQRYERQFTELGDALGSIEAVRESDSETQLSGVWTLSGSSAIRARVAELLGEADEEVVYLVGDDAALSEETLARLDAASRRGLPLYVGTATDSIYGRIETAVPGVKRFDSWIDWLWSSGEPEDAWTLGQILVVDRHAVLVSAHRASPGDGDEDSAVWTAGVGNGLGMVAGRLLSAGIERLERSEATDTADDPDEDSR